MILARLKNETRRRHEQLESRMDVLEESFTLEDYKRMLGRFYGFFEPFDEKISRAIEREKIRFDYESRRKAASLEEDLKNLGADRAEIDALPRCASTPELGSAEAVFGCLYVVEGATLGGQIISRRLAEKFGVRPGEGGSFFSGYGRETSAKWKEFGATLTGFSESGETVGTGKTESDTGQARGGGGDDLIVRAALETFETLEEWLFEKSRVC